MSGGDERAEDGRERQEAQEAGALESPAEEAAPAMKDESADAGSDADAGADADAEGKYGFVDYTHASPFERLIDEVEGAFKRWKSDEASDEGNGAAHTKLIFYEDESYRLLHHVHRTQSDKAMNEKGWNTIAQELAEPRDDFPGIGHRITRWFGVGEFVVLLPVSKEECSVAEATLLISVLSTAVSQACWAIPVFVPVFEPERGSYLGYCVDPEAHVVARFDSDFRDSMPPGYSSARQLSTYLESKLEEMGNVQIEQQCISLRYTYFLVGFDEYAFQASALDGDGAETVPWGVDEDPLEESQDITGADEWRLRALFHSDDDGRITALLRAISTAWSDAVGMNAFPQMDLEQDVARATHALRASRSASDMVGRRDDSSSPVRSSGESSDDAQNVGIQALQAISEGFAHNLSGTSVQAIHSALSDVFEPIPWQEDASGERVRDRSFSCRAAPTMSLLSIFSMYLAAQGGVRGMGILWREFVRELRWHWEHSVPLPRLDSSPPDFSTCLVHQKIQKLAFCIREKIERRAREAPEPAEGWDAAANILRDSSVSKSGAHQTNRVDKSEDSSDKSAHSPESSTVEKGPNDEGKTEDIDDLVGKRHDGAPNEDSGQQRSDGNDGHTDDSEEDDDDDEDFASAEEDNDDEDDTSYRAPLPDGFPLPVGINRDISGERLLLYDVALREPVTQSEGVVTEDELMARQQVLVSLGEGAVASSTKTRLQSASLRSDMAAFKAANPGSVFEDFVRWHSPKDWSAGGGRRGTLSDRMRSGDNIWQRMWTETHPLPVHQQQPLFDVEKEAEKVLHWLETLPPADMFAQISRVVLSTSLDLLGETAVSELEPVSNALAKARAASAVTASRVAVSPDGEMWGGEGEGASEDDDATTALESAIASVAAAEHTASRASSLLQKLPACEKLVSELVTSGLAGVQDAAQRRDVQRLFAGRSEMPAADAREAIIRATSRHGAATLPQRLYAAVGEGDAPRNDAVVGLLPTLASSVRASLHALAPAVAAEMLPRVHWTVSVLRAVRGTWGSTCFRVSSTQSTSSVKWTPGIDARLRELVSRHAILLDQLGSGTQNRSAQELARLSKEESRLRSVAEGVQELDSLQGDVAAAEALLAESKGDADAADFAKAERSAAQVAIDELRRQLVRELLPRDEADEGNAVLEVRAGAGGDEASLFAGDLLRLYIRFCERKRFKFEEMSVSSTEVGGIREAVARVSGRGVFSILKHESGVHRVQRVPRTETQGRVHTSTASVAVLPEASEVDVAIDDKDLRIDVYRSGGAGGQHVNTTDSAVRVTHLPTGLSVSIQDDRSQHKNKAKALAVLRARLLDRARQEEADRRSSARQSLIGTGDRSERIRTYNFPQGRVTDHRIGMTLHDMDGVMDGAAVEEFAAALQSAAEADMLERIDEIV